MSRAIDFAIKKYNTFSRYVNRTYTDNPAEILPGVKSTDTRVLDLAREFSDATANINVRSKNGFLEEPFMLGNFDGIRQITGFPSNPLGSKPPSQQGAIPRDPEFDRLLALTTKVLTMECKPTGISINKTSSVGFPFRTFELDVKLKALKSFITNYDRIITSCQKTNDGSMFIDDWIGEYDFAPISLEGRRFQHTDKIIRDSNGISSKLRDVFDWTGKKVQANRSIDGYRDFFRTRARFVYGAPGSLNYGAQFFANALRKRMAERFEFMFYTGPHNFADKVKNFDAIISADVTAFDQNFDDHVTNIIINSIQCYDDSIKQLMHLMVRMPVLQKNDYIDGKGYKLSQSLSERLNPVSSNPSGWAWVTEFAKIVGVTLMVCTANKLFRVDETNIVALLEGKLDIAFLNTGDDMVFLFRNDEILSAFRKRIGKDLSFYKFKLEMEDIVNYLGMALRRDSSGTSALLDIRNIVIKTHVPERGISSIHKPFFAFGFRSKLDIYSSHPMFNEVFQPWNKMVKKHFGKDILSIIELDKVPRNTGNALNVADKIFLDNPDSIHYKLDANDVTPDLLSEVFAYVDVANFKKLNGHLKGVV